MVLLVAALAVAGCKPDPEACEVAVCTDDSDCAVSTFCDGDCCVPAVSGCGESPTAECRIDSDCAPGSICDPELCTCSVPGCGEIDGDCTSDADCAAGASCDVERCVCVACPATAECQDAADCGLRERCDTTSCSCVSTCGEMLSDECSSDADCLVGTCELTECACYGFDALTISNLATFTGAGLPATCQFEEERDCTVGSFSANLTVRVIEPGMIEIVQNPGAQTSTGSFSLGVTFYTADAAAGYDEIYLGQFERTVGTDPMAALTTDTVVIRGLNASGPQGSLAAVEMTRSEAALANGAHTGNTAAIDNFLGGTSNVCVYTVSCTFDP